MALTQAQWFTRLKRWTPSWFLLTEEKNIAILNGIAKVLAERADEVDALVANTFIGTAESEWLQSIGHERSIDLMDGETLAQYRVRVRNSNTSAKLALEDIEAIVEGFITTGTFYVHEDYNGSFFSDRGYYCNRRDLIFSTVINGFTIFVDNQGNIETLQAIAAAVNNVKAFGCLYRLVERAA